MKKLLFATLLLLAAGCDANLTQTPLPNQPAASSTPVLPSPGQYLKPPTNPPVPAPLPPPTKPVVCAQDAKLCPDGSYVSRVPPSCEFAPCP